MQIKYHTNDGRIFDTEQQALEHEKELEKYTSLIEAAKEISKICKDNPCWDCPLYNPDTEKCPFEDIDNDNVFVNPSYWNFE